MMPRNVRLLQLHAMFMNMLFLLPVLIPYYRDMLGLGFREFLIGEAAFSTTMVLMEVPTGWISDIWGRRRTLIAASAVWTGGFLFLWQAGGFFEAVAAQAILGVGVSLLSGTNSALLYDSLLEAGKENEYRRLEGFRQGLGLYVIGGASMTGGLLYTISPHLPMLATVLAGLAAIGVALAMNEPARRTAPVHKHPLADMIQTMRYALRGHAEVGAIILIAAILFSSTKMAMWSQQPYYMMLGIPPGWFGVLMAVGFVTGGLGGHFGHLADGRLRNVTVLLISLGMIFTATFISGMWPGYHGVALLMFSSSAIFGFANPRLQDAINRRVESDRRATILSTANLMVHVFAVPLMLVIGQAEDRFGIDRALHVISLMAVMGMMLAGILLRRRNLTAS